MTSALNIIVTLAAIVLLPVLALPFLLPWVGKLIGIQIRSKTRSRRAVLLSKASEDEKESKGGNVAQNLAAVNADWEGVIGFFHPFCNAGGGGERVLWAAVRATQERYPKALCVVYTGDHDVDKDTILSNVKNRFNIPLHPPRIAFLYLSTRDFLMAQRWPYFTLLGQSIGSLIVAWDAFTLLAPDIFVDTMGYAFTLALAKFLFPESPTGAYVHYPTISTDMLGSLDDETGRGVNGGLGRGIKGAVKKYYWQLFAKIYSWVGGRVDVVMTNSTWTQNHIKSLWGPTRRNRAYTRDTSVVFPPVAVEELEEAIPVDEESERYRQKDILYIAQFRPEKDHHNIIDAFATFLKTTSEQALAKQGSSPRLVLVGSVRDEKDKTLVYKLRVLTRELHVADNVEFIINAQWSQILDKLRTSWVGVNGMWNEHFGIGVVEYQAAGLISVVDDSGGPKIDIVVPIDGEPTGFHAKSVNDFAAGFERALSLSPSDTIAMRKRARKSAQRFSEDVFRSSWNVQMDKLIQLQVTPLSQRKDLKLA